VQRDQTVDKMTTRMTDAAYFYNACRTGQFEVVRAALVAAKNNRKNYDVNVIMPETGDTLLMAVVSQRFVELKSFPK